MGLFGTNYSAEYNDVYSNFKHISGLPCSEGTAVTLHFCPRYGRIEIEERFGTKNSYNLAFEKLTNIGILTDREILEKQKSVVGRAVVGGLLLGPLGSIVGGMSGIGSKKKSTLRNFLVINYMSCGVPNVLTFECDGFDNSKFYNEVKKFISDHSNGSIEL